MYIKDFTLPITILLLSCFLHRCVSMISTDPRHKSSCSVDQTCNGLTIRDPFWISNSQQLVCGQEGFGISGNSNKPVMKISGNSFLVRNISYENQTLWLAHLGFLNSSSSSTCSVPRNNISLKGTPFYFGPSTVKLYFLYNCRIPCKKLWVYRVLCASNSSHCSFATFLYEMYRYPNYLTDLCSASVSTLVNVDDFPKVLLMGYMDVLKRDFALIWEVKRKSESSLLGQLGIGFGVPFVIAFVSVVAFCACRNRYPKHDATSLKRETLSSETSLDDLLNSKNRAAAHVHVFDYRELEEATDCFDAKLKVGDGGFAEVYKGKLKDGRIVAVKRLYETGCRRVQQFLNEIEILTRLRHQNLVTLYGCTCTNKDLLLMYEYISNGTVSDHIHGTIEEKRDKPLCWITRLNIAVQTASTLSYLHASGVIHRDVKATNIVLDENFIVKVGDVGISRAFPSNVTHVTTAPQGTPGYLDPSYHECYRLTEKSDVYSFGVVLIELISSQLAVDMDRDPKEINLSTMAINKIQKQKLPELVDPHIGFESDYEVQGLVIDVAELAFQCLQSERDLRPTMHDVFDILQEILTKDYTID